MSGLHTRSALLRHAEIGLARERRTKALEQITRNLIGGTCIALAGAAIGACGIAAIAWGVRYVFKPLLDALGVTA